MKNTQNKCINHGGYNPEIKNLVCGIEPEKICAGYNTRCGSYIYSNPSKKTRGEPYEGSGDGN